MWLTVFPMALGHDLTIGVPLRADAFELSVEKVAFIDDFANADEQDQFTQDFQKLDAMYQVLR